MGAERRLDIDLLRAIAVMAVILFHFDVPGIEGGFIGVDVFFVISGFLISGQIAGRIYAGDFSYAVFFARRARRLVPALAATLLLTWCASLFILTPDTLNHTLKEIGFAAAYLSNFSYWLESGYFDTAAITKPLLHTWSLSVEEQFYVLWPLLMLVAIRSGQKLLLPILGLLSLIACELMMRQDPSAAFFLFPFRIFEFALGAVIWDIRKPKPGRTVNLISLLALAAIVASAIVLHERSHFPGLAVLPACLGTAWIIAARPDFMNRHNVLSALGGWIGKVSYSAYMVHWPLVVFYVALFGEEIGWRGFIPLMASTLLLSELMWRFVEQPFLRAPLAVRQFVWSVPASVAFSLMLIVAGVPLYTQIHSARVDLIALVQNQETRREFLPRVRQGLSIENDPASPRVTVIGDSHAVDVSIALRLSATEPVAITMLRSHCDPLTTAFSEEELIRLYENHGNEYATADKCRAVHRDLLSQIQGENPEILIFSERWRAETLPYLAETIRTIKAHTGAAVVLFGRQQEFAGYPGQMVNRVESADELNREAWRRRKDHSDLNKGLAAIAAETASVYIDRGLIVCPVENECDYLIDGQLTYVDPSHWTERGMRLFGKRLFAEIVDRKLLVNASRKGPSPGGSGY